MIKICIDDYIDNSIYLMRTKSLTVLSDDIWRKDKSEANESDQDHLRGGKEMESA